MQKGFHISCLLILYVLSESSENISDDGLENLILNCIFFIFIVIFIMQSLPAVIIAMTFHEYAHAFVADKLGDDTPRKQGRLTLNPLKHIEPVGFFLLLFAGFGWGRPVEINTNRFNKNMDKSKGEAIVSFAGPLMNIILAIVSAFIVGLILKFNLLNKMQYAEIVVIFMMQLLYINLGLGIFNLIPLPPLDGSKILRHFLPYNSKVWFDNNQYIFYIAFIIIWVLGLASYIVSPVISFLGKWILEFVYIILGL